MRRLEPQQLLQEIQGRQPLAQDVVDQVRTILEDVRRHGDQALLAYTRRWDAPALTEAELEVPASALREALEDLPAQQRQALEQAAARIAAYHRRLVPREQHWLDAAGNRLGQLIRPLERVGIYVPGGRAAYPSTVLMAAIPAKLVGVQEIVLVTPPRQDGSIPPMVLAAAALAGVHRVFRIGGAQAIAALAYGTRTVPAVEKIVGPGNAYVTAAKALVASQVGIDGLAGPSEIVVVADDSARPHWVAADLLAQAEHDPMAVVGCLSDSADLLDQVADQVRQQLATAPRAAIAAPALERGFLVQTRDLAEAMELANRLAPEHLSLQVRDPAAWLPRVRAAGAVFAGPYAPVAAGDYAAGTNHILPTGGAARFQSGLNPEAFVRRIPLFAGTQPGLAAWAQAAEVLAEAEGLPAHAASVRLRQQDWPVPGDPGATAPAQGTALKAPAAAADGRASSPAPATGGYQVADGDAPIKLDANESEPWPQPLRAQLAGRLAAQLERSAPHRYPAGRLRQEVTELVAQYAGVPGEAVVLGNGSDELVQAVLGTLGSQCTAVVSPSPTFGYYASAAAAAGLPYQPVAFPPDRPVTAGPLLAALDAWPGQKLVFLCRPNNPTGLGCSPEVVAQLLARADAWLVVDEAYAEFAGDSVLAQGGGPVLERWPRLVVLRTLSKAFGLAGARVGYGLAAPALARRLRQWTQPYNVNTFSLEAARLALEHRDLFLHRAEEVRQRRERLFQALATIPGVAPVPSLANFILFRVERDPTTPEQPRAAELQRQLRERGIAVRYFPWEPALADYLRVTVGTDGENAAFLQALRELLRAGAPERWPTERGG